MIAPAYRKALISVGGNTHVLRAMAFLWKAIPYKPRRAVIPDVDLASFVLTVDGAVDHPLSLSWQDLKALPRIDREVRMDCVGGFRNNSIMAGRTGAQHSGLGRR